MEENTKINEIKNMINLESIQGHITNRSGASNGNSNSPSPVKKGQKTEPTMRRESLNKITKFEGNQVQCPKCGSEIAVS